MADKKNVFTITISATDKATATVKKVNESISKFVRPVTEVKRATSALGKEMGLGKIGKGFKDVAVAATDAAREASKIVAPLAAIVGVGSIIGIVKLSKTWGDLGSEISRTSQIIGISTHDLQAFRGAARLAGLSSDSMTAGLKTLGGTMQDALVGRNNDALYVMRRLGIQMKYTANGAIDTGAALLDLSEIMQTSNMSVQSKRSLAQVFGLEEMLPLLMKGPEAIKAYLDQMERSNTIMGGDALKSADTYRESMEKLMMGLKNFGYTIGNVLIPVLQPLVDKITTWVTANKQLIATKLADVARDIAGALKEIDWMAAIDGISDFVKGVVKAVDWVGGWKVALAGLAFVIATPLLSAIANLTTALIALGGVMIANPVGAIITGITLGVLGLAFVGYELVTHWEEVKNQWGDIWKSMAEGVNGLIESLNRVPFVNIPKIDTRHGASGSWDNPSGGNFGGKGASGSWGGPASLSSVASPDLLGLVKNLEGSGDNAISKAGAIGTYQIMPDTARQFGFDPTKLNDPIYSEKVARTILGDLSKKYPGDLDAILTGYNAGPGRADTFLRSGRNAALLPKETQGYLARARALISGTGPAVATPYSPVPGAFPNIARNGSAGAAGAPYAQGSGAIIVTVNFENAPRGMKTTTQTKGNVIANTKIGFAMPEFGAL